MRLQWNHCKEKKKRLTLNFRTYALPPPSSPFLPHERVSVGIRTSQRSLSPSQCPGVWTGRPAGRGQRLYTRLWGRNAQTCLKQNRHTVDEDKSISVIDYGDNGKTEQRWDTEAINKAWEHETWTFESVSPRHRRQRRRKTVQVRKICDRYGGLESLTAQG